MTVHDAARRLFELRPMTHELATALNPAVTREQTRTACLATDHPSTGAHA
ncbi:hypothetical protein [Kitasatospora phosalacinea]|uniref:Uncharacterized protein n=1 Tax=Kitasatospora phosalacinea TaxID=2065 RepID=A0ABW6GD64_9ACTN